MKARTFFTFFLAINSLCLLLATNAILGDESLSAEEILAQKLASAQTSNQISKGLRKKRGPRLISMYFDNEDLIDVINFLAAEKGVNVVLPAGANAINNKLTLHYEERIPLDDAWNVLYTILEISGYSLIEKGDTYTIVKINKEIGREPAPLYIAVKPERLPNTDERIRYIYYLANLRITDDSNADLIAIMKDLLPDTSVYKFDSASNSIILCDKSNNIKQIMAIVQAFDTAEIQDKPTVIQLNHVPADWLANLLNEQILRNTNDPNKLRLLDQRKQSEATFFAKNVRIVSMPRNNQLVVLGKPQAVERIKDFIYKYIDVALESGRSILHSYQLQYLDAEKFAGVLERIVQTKKEGGTDQSKSSTDSDASGFERYFGEVKVMVDKPKTASGQTPDGASQGTNSIVVACRTGDWTHIKKLIEDLDAPQPLVIIEVLIADLNTNDLRALGTALRNPALMSPPNVNFQSAQVQQILTDVDSSGNPTTLQADLLRNAFTNSAGNPTSSLINFPAGSTAIALNDPATGSTFNLWQLLQSFASTRILSHPHVIATNNRKASIVVKQSRYLQDEASGTTGGTTTATRKWVEASYEINLTPRISSVDTVSLNISIQISDFLNAPTGAGSPASGNRTDRNVTTNANVPSGCVLCLGGLTEITTNNTLNETPILGQIPIIGWFFKYRSGQVQRNHLMVFLSPTIVDPRKRGSAGSYTRDQIELAKAYGREGLLFDNLHDPITRWFFTQSRKDPSDNLDNFAMTDELISRDLERKGTLQGLITADNTRKTPALAAPPPKTLAEQLTVTQAKPDRTTQLKGMLNTTDIKTPSRT